MSDRGSLHEVGSRCSTGIVRPASAAETRSRPSAGVAPRQKLRLRRDRGGQLCGDEYERLVGSNRPASVTRVAKACCSRLEAHAGFRVYLSLFNGPLKKAKLGRKVRNSGGLDHFPSP